MNMNEELLWLQNQSFAKYKISSSSEDHIITVFSDQLYSLFTSKIYYKFSKFSNLNNSSLWNCLNCLFICVSSQYMMCVFTFYWDKFFMIVRWKSWLQEEIVFFGWPCYSLLYYLAGHLFMNFIAYQ